VFGVAVRLICPIGAPFFQDIPLSPQGDALGYPPSALQADEGIRVNLRPSAVPFLNQELATMPKRFRLATLLTIGPLLALVVALASWVIVLRDQLVELDQRVTVLELTPPLTTMAGDYSDVGVHIDVDRAMQLESLSVPRY
jgi:hypothetical protein